MRLTAAGDSRMDNVIGSEALPVTGEMRNAGPGERARCNRFASPRLQAAAGRVAVGAAVFATFLVFSAVRSPVPGVNEPHYLAKARHFWNPDWCRGDFFLESAEAHVVFYHTAGRLADWLTLEQAAWTGRVLALAVLAAGWTALVWRLVPGRWSPWWAACVFLLLAALGDFSGEWIVGGVEGKVFAYGFLFGAVALRRRHLQRAAVCAGLAISFHPIVGLWGLLAALPGQLYRLRRARPVVRSRDTRRLATSAGLLIACSLPGLLPALRMLGRATPPVAAEANRIQVFDRLKHHLDPLEFPASAYAGYAVLVLVSLAGRRFAVRRTGERDFAWLVTGSLGIALAGLAIGLRADESQSKELMNLRAGLLKFYPFRLADVLVPLAFSVTLVGLARRWAASETWPRHHLAAATRRRLVWPAFTAALAAALILPAVDRNPSRLPTDELADWLDVCRWVKHYGHAESSFLTPPESWAFKWCAERPEFVTRKDCPQDAAGILEWRRRMDERGQWLSALRGSLQEGTFRETLGWLGDELDVTHVIIYSGWRAPTPALYRNRTFAVYAASGGTGP